MHTVVSLAGDANARAVNLGQAIDIEDFDAQLVRDAVAHLLAPALGTDNALLQVELVAQAARGYFLGEQKRIARRAPVMTVECKSCIILSCFSVLPGPIGIAMAPKRSQPSWKPIPAVHRP